MSVILFTAAWLFIGNFWSIATTWWTVNISTGIIIFSAVLYLIVGLPVVIFFFIELLRLKSRLKWLIAMEVMIFSVFIVPPPRNADAIRVWLAKVYDVWMHGKKIIRPYVHYNTPDAFTLFHLPLINLWDGQIFQLSIWIALCATIIVLTKIGRAYTSDRVIALGLCLFIFNPLIILGSTVVITDVPVFLAVAGMIYAMILSEQGRFNKSMVLVVLFMSFGMNIKYNMLMFLPAVLYWSMKKVWTDGINWKSLPLCMVFFGLAIYPYYMNYVNIGNPVWPALTKYFPARNPLWDTVVLHTVGPYLGGKRNIFSFFESFSRLFIMPQYINPLAICTIFFIFARYKHLNFIPALTAAAYLFLLWLMMPRFAGDERVMMPQFAGDERVRYVLYLFPVIVPFGIIRIYEMASSYRTGEKLKKVFEISVVVTVVVYLLFTIVYSKDAFRYLIERDKEVWHRDTWYYKDYDWINKNIMLDKSGQILVVVSNQQTYYLRKPYVNGDDESALIDWRLMTDQNTIMSELNKYNIQYIFIDEDFVKGDPDMKRAFDILIEKGMIDKIRQNRTTLTSSRIRNIYSETQTVLYKVNTKKEIPNHKTQITNKFQ